MTSPFPLFDMSSHMHAVLPRRTSRSSGMSQPVCRSSRVEKPRSNHNSPRTTERRRTTTESKLYATLDDHYKMMFGDAGAEEVTQTRPQPSRPLSWHPSSAQFQASRSSPYAEPTVHQDWSRQYPVSSQNSPHGSDFYSISTRNSMYEPTSNYFTSPNMAGVHRGSDDSGNSWQSVPQQSSTYAHSAMCTPVAEPLPWYLQQWAQKNQVEARSAGRHGSSDLVSIQQNNQQDHEMEADDGKELVALGLYDGPEPSWNGFGEATGKGLKLEETWQPPEDEDEDDDEDDASSEASIEEFSPPFPPVNQQSQQLQLPVHVKTQKAGSMEGRSFFFDEDETVSKEWWFQQLKQPSVPVRDAGLRYGWL